MVDRAHPRLKYLQIIRTHSSPEVFSDEMRALIAFDRYFTPAYLELLWLAPRQKNEECTQDLIDGILLMLKSIITRKNIRLKLTYHWSALEVEAFKLLLQNFRHYHTDSWAQKITLRLYEWLVPLLLDIPHQAVTELDLQMFKERVLRH